MISYSRFFGILIMVIMVFSCSEDTVETIQNGTITGKVVERSNFNPIINAKITLSSNNDAVFSDANGNFTLKNVAIGQQSVKAEKDGFITAFEAADLTSGSTVNVIFELDVSTAANRPPETPLLLSPEDNTVDQEIALELIWSASDPDEDEMVFKVELRNDANTTVATFEELTDTTLAISGLNYGVKYFWQVSATDNINDEVWSNVRSFETKADPEHRFLFVRNIEGNDVIFSGAEDGSELQLTASSANCWRPRKNVNSGLIAYLRTVGAEIHLFSMEPDGSNNIQITGGVPIAGANLSEIDFCWSSNGEKLLYPNSDKLYMINKDGSGLNLIYQTPDGSLITECDWSSDGTMIALKTNNLDGYNIAIYTIDMAGAVLSTILSGVSGAAGGINFSVDNSFLLYCYDVSGFESPDYRQLNTHVYLYDIALTTVTDISGDKPDGFLDIDPRFSPNEAEIIFTHTSNDGLSEKKVFKVDATSISDRVELFSNAQMPDWE